MKTAKIVLIIVAVALIIVGLILSIIAFARNDLYDNVFDISKNMKTVQNTYKIDDNFKNISIDDVEADVTIILADDNICKVVCDESDKIYHKVDVVDNTLTIKRVNSRKWFEKIITFDFGKMGTV